MPQDTTEGQGDSRSSPTPLMSVLQRSKGSYRNVSTTSTGGILNDVTTFHWAFRPQVSQLFSSPGWALEIPANELSGNKPHPTLSERRCGQESRQVKSHLYLRPEDGN